LIRQIKSLIRQIKSLIRQIKSLIRQINWFDPRDQVFRSIKQTF